MGTIIIEEATNCSNKRVEIIGIINLEIIRRNPYTLFSMEITG